MSTQRIGVLRFAFCVLRQAAVRGASARSRFCEFILVTRKIVSVKVDVVKGVEAREGSGEHNSTKY